MFIKFSKEDSSMILKLCLSPKVDAGVTFFAQGYALWSRNLDDTSETNLAAAPGAALIKSPTGNPTGICQSDCQSVSLKSKCRILLAQTACSRAQHVLSVRVHFNFWFLKPTGRLRACKNKAKTICGKVSV